MRWETDMRLMKRRVHARVAAISAFIFALALTSSAARAEDKTYVMKLGIATINDAQHEWCRRFVAKVEKDSGGRIKGEIYPASQLGPIPRQIEGVQFGAIQGYVGPPEFLVGVDDRYQVLSAPGLVTDMEHGIRVASDVETAKACQQAISQGQYSKQRLRNSRARGRYRLSERNSRGAALWGIRVA